VSWLVSLYLVAANCSDNPANSVSIPTSTLSASCSAIVGCHIATAAIKSMIRNLPIYETKRKKM
jgi:phosphate/sulfate permease